MPYLSEYWDEQNKDDVYFVCGFSWSSGMPFSPDINDFLEDFGGDSVNYFVVVGAFNVLMFSESYNGVNHYEAIDMVGEAIDSFNKIAIVDTVPGQTLYPGDVVDIDVNGLFAHPLGENVVVSIKSNSNPQVVSAEINDKVVTLRSLDVGMSEITLLGTDGILSVSYSFDVGVFEPNERYAVIIDLSGSPTGNALKTSVENNYSLGTVFVTDEITLAPLENADAVFVLLGAFDDNYVLSEGDVVLLIDYLNAGGNLYMEGGDTWFFDEPTSLHSMFKIEGVHDGYDSLIDVDGAGFLNGLNWTYSGSGKYFDRLEPIASAVTIFKDAEKGYNYGVAYDSGTYKTVGTSFELTGLGGKDSLDDAVGGIFDFFAIGSVSTPEDIAVASVLKGNYPNPFNPETNIAFTLNNDVDNVELIIYNIKGQKVRTLVESRLSAGEHTVSWNGKDNNGRNVASGIYFYKMKAGDFSCTKKMVLMK